MDGQDSIFPLLKNAWIYQFGDKHYYFTKEKDKKKNKINETMTSSMEPLLKR